MNGLRAEIWSRLAVEIEQGPPARRKKAHDLATMAISLLCEDIEAGTRTEWDERRIAAARTMGNGCAAAGWPLDEVLELLGRAGEETVAVLAATPGTAAGRLKALAETCNRFLRELLRGYQETTLAVASPRSAAHDDAVALLRGDAATDQGRFAPAYAVLAFRTVSASTVDESVFGEPGTGVLTALCEHGGYVLVPAGDEETGFARCAGLHAALPEKTWAGVSWQKTGRLPAGRAEALDVVTAALAARRPPGCYLLGDVLVEYAVLTQRPVADLLVAKIEPITRNEVLLETLRALLAADGNRSKAATALIIHRSTLDYRLQRIEQLTGYDPTSLRQLHILSTALTAHEATTTPPPPLPLEESD
ncbi:PucR family transcriptional regulator [Amycolatopsis tolypomycina]|uniref:PucR family transcriptional regulator n=1 Tax=Amycolatopsis tolypomycina TaxID=208445 RepID=UPI000B810824|nr:helix-turn-helix domain-containing protein [Amycolatopsis tolypomycina]